MAFTLENVLTIDHLTAYDAKLKPYIDSDKTKSFKYVEVRDNAVCFFADPAPLADTEPSYKVDFPVELFLDQTRTKFEQVFSWNDVEYPGSTDPGLDGNPVLVLAVKGDDGSVVYSFLDMHTLVDVTVPAGGDAGDILTKKSGADYDMEWTKPAEGTVIDSDPAEGSDNAVSSGGVFTALDGKVDKVDGKQLSTEDYTTEEKEKLASLNNYDDAALLAALDLKVDKVDGMGLSSNDYTTEEKEKLAGLENYDDTALADRVTAIEDDYLTSADKTELTDAATAISDRVTAIENDYLTSADKTELQTETDTKIANRVGAIPDATTIKEYVDNTVGSGGTDAADAIATAKQEAIEAANLYTDGKATELTEAIEQKQDAITGTAGQIVGFDADGKPVAQDAAAGIVVDPEPTQDSPNAVSSGGVYAALQDKQDALVGTEGQFVGFDADGNVLAQEVPAVRPVEMTQAEYDQLTDEQKMDGTVRYIVDGVTMGAVPGGGTFGQVLGKLSDDDGDYGWIDQTGGTGGTPDLVVTGEYSIGGDGTWSVSNVSETFATIDAALTAGQSVSLKVYPAGTTENPYILYPAMHYANMGIMFALAVGDGGQVTALNVMLTPDGSAVMSQANYKFDEKQDKLVGGTTGQVLTKKSNADGDVEWADAQGGDGVGGERLAIGTILSYTGAVAPMGYLLCDGQAVSRTDYADLFAVIGETYGAGDGSTTFNVPNLSDKFLQGSGTNALGTEMEAGLPNITASSGRSIYTGETGSPTGAFAFSTTSTKNYESSGTSTNRWSGMTLDASKSNAIYGNSDTVQPPALVVTFIIKATDYAAVPQNAIDDTATTDANVWSAQKVQAELDARTEIDDTTTSPDTVWSSEKTQAELDAKKVALIVTADLQESDEGSSISNISHTYAEITAALDAGQPTLLQLHLDENSDNVSDGYYECALLTRTDTFLQYAMLMPMGESLVSMVVTLPADETSSPVIQNPRMNLNVKQDKITGTAGQVVALDSSGNAAGTYTVVGDSPADTDLATVAFARAAANATFTLNDTTLVITTV